ncbi:262_t:CDS:2, partial [Funneliformis geosporum]
ISKLSTKLSVDDNKCYGMIPYIAPEIFQGQKYEKYTKASDIYSFGMIMWEIIAGRRPFWNFQDSDTDLIIQICDGFRPPIITNAPKGYIELMQNCWDSNPNKRPNIDEICKLIDEIILNEENNPTKIIISPDIGPIIENKLYGSTIILPEFTGFLKSSRIIDESIKDSCNDNINNSK